MSFFISVFVHLLILCALLYLFKVVPDMRLPQRIYSVKILRPLVKAPPEAKEDKPVTVEKEKESKPAPQKPKPKEKEQKKEPEPQKQEKPMDVSVDEESTDQTSMVVDAPRFPFSYYLEAIERKVEGREVSAEPNEEPKAQVIDLMEALKASLVAKETARKPAKRAPRAVAKKKRASKKSSSKQ